MENEPKHRNIVVVITEETLQDQDQRETIDQSLTQKSLHIKPDLSRIYLF